MRHQRARITSVNQSVPRAVSLPTKRRLCLCGMSPQVNLTAIIWGEFGTRPWWLALLACGGAYWPLPLEPSAMTSRHLHYCGHAMQMQCKHPNIQKCKHPNIQTSKQPNIQKCKHPNIQTSKHPNIQKCKHPNIQTSKNANIQTSKPPNIQTSKNANIQTSKNANIQTSKHPKMQTSKHPNIQTSKHANIQKCKHPNSRPAESAIGANSAVCCCHLSCRERPHSTALAFATTASFR